MTTEHNVESITTYAVVVVTSSYAWLIDSSNDLMALGGLVLLGVRLYVDIRQLRKGKESK
jgi:hypothetical protein